MRALHLDIYVLPALGPSVVQCHKRSLISGQRVRHAKKRSGAARKGLLICMG